MSYKDIAPALVRELIACDYETGLMTWKHREARHCHGSQASADYFNRRYAGTPALAAVDRCRNHRSGAILGHSVRAHHAVWCHYYGEWPTQWLDHIHGADKGDGIHNLREATPRQNQRNMKLRAGHPSGVMGVSLDQISGKYVARIANGKGGMKTLGKFEHFDDAVAVRKAAERSHGYHPNHGRAA